LEDEFVQGEFEKESPSYLIAKFSTRNEEEKEGTNEDKKEVEEREEKREERCASSETIREEQ
jgi:hypothetical protein